MNYSTLIKLPLAVLMLPLLALPGCGEDVPATTIAETQAHAQTDLQFETKRSEIIKTFFTLGLGQEQYNNFIEQTEEAGFDYAGQALFILEVGRIAGLVNVNFGNWVMASPSIFTYDGIVVELSGNLAQQTLTIEQNIDTYYEQCQCTVNTKGTILFHIESMAVDGTVFIADHFTITIPSLTVTGPSGKMLISDSNISGIDFIYDNQALSIIHNIGGDTIWPTQVEAFNWNISNQSGGVRIDSHLTGSAGALETVNTDSNTAINILSPDLQIDLNATLIEP